MTKTKSCAISSFSQTDRQRETQTESCCAISSFKQPDRQTDRQTDRERHRPRVVVQYQASNNQTDRQTERERDTDRELLCNIQLHTEQLLDDLYSDVSSTTEIHCQLTTTTLHTNT